MGPNRCPNPALLTWRCCLPNQGRELSEHLATERPVLRKTAAIDVDYNQAYLSILLRLTHASPAFFDETIALYKQLKGEPGSGFDGVEAKKIVWDFFLVGEMPEEDYLRSQNVDPPLVRELVGRVTKMCSSIPECMNIPSNQVVHKRRLDTMQRHLTAVSSGKFGHACERCNHCAEHSPLADIHCVGIDVPFI